MIYREKELTSSDLPWLVSLPDGTKVDVFGASPAGGYYMEVNHRLYVDSVQYSTWILEFLSD
jgi:hypothetical protein